MPGDPSTTPTLWQEPALWIGLGALFLILVAGCEEVERRWRERGK